MLIKYGMVAARYDFALSRYMYWLYISACLFVIIFCNKYWRLEVWGKNKELMASLLRVYDTAAWHILHLWAISSLNRVVDLTTPSSISPRGWEDKALRIAIKTSPTHNLVIRIVMDCQTLDSFSMSGTIAKLWNKVSELWNKCQNLIMYRQTMWQTSRTPTKFTKLLEPEQSSPWRLSFVTIVV